MGDRSKVFFGSAARQHAHQAQASDLPLSKKVTLFIHRHDHTAHQPQPSTFLTSPFRLVTVEMCRPTSETNVPPPQKSETVSRIMSANRPKNSKPELQLRKALWQAGLKGYRLHYKIKLRPELIKGEDRSTRDRATGTVRPDISFVGKKLAIFVHGCFWQ